MAIKTKLNKKKGTKQKQKQRQQQSVIVKIDQSKRVVQRERQSKPQPIIQQPPPMNIMISPPPQLSISDAMRQQQPRFISQQDQQVRQPIAQTTTRPPQTLQPTVDGNSAIGKIVFTDFVEDTPILARDILVGSDVPQTRLTAKSLEQHNFKESRKEGEDLQDRGITQNTLLSSPNRFAALQDDEDAQTEHGEISMNPKANVKYLLYKLDNNEISIKKGDVSLLKKFDGQGSLSKNNKDYKRIVKKYITRN